MASVLAVMGPTPRIRFQPLTGLVRALPDMDSSINLADPELDVMQLPRQCEPLRRSLAKVILVLPNGRYGYRREDKFNQCVHFTQRT